MILNSAAMKRRTIAAITVATLFVFVSPPSGQASAASWTVALAAASHGEAQAQTLPAAPASPSAACVSATTKTIKVSWTAVAHATSYLTYQSTTSAGGTYTVTAGGTYSGTTWTSASLANGNYWYEVAAVIGTHWTGAKSVATGETTIQTGATTCVQP